MQKNLSNFVAFILTHGRPNKVYTYRTLRKQGYTGDIVLLVDDEDDLAEEYKDRYGDEVYVFCKSEVAKYTDACDNWSRRDVILFARNVCHSVARELGYRYFLQLDDDYVDFRYKYDSNLEYGDKAVLWCLDTLFKIWLDFYKTIPAQAVAIAQGGDFFGGKKGTKASKLTLWRKAMNTFMCDVERPFSFRGRINEDVNTYVGDGAKGALFLTIPNLAIQQKQSQSNAGGMTDLYLDSGTYVKSFYTVIVAPSCTDIRMMSSKHPRLHHHINWNNAVPKILREDCKK